MRWMFAAGLMLASTPLPALAIMSGEESAIVASSDPDYARGKAAFLEGDWQGAIDNLDLVIARRPWHDNAENMLGFAWRKLGNYDEAFRHYRRALELNPRHRGALAYMGEAYLDLGRIAEAQETALRLAEVCTYVVMAFDNQGWKSGCEELNVLEASFKEHGVPLPEAKTF